MTAVKSQQAIFEYECINTLDFERRLTELGYEISDSIGHICNAQKEAFIEFVRRETDKFSIILDGTDDLIFYVKDIDTLMLIEWTTELGPRDVSSLVTYSKPFDKLEQIGFNKTFIKAFFKPYLRDSRKLASGEYTRVRAWHWDKGQQKAISSWCSINKSKLSSIIERLYPDINIQELLIRYSESESCILLLNGIPGVGKTTLARYIALQARVDEVVFVKDQRVLEDSSFWTQIAHEDQVLIVLDDLTSSIGASERHKPFLENLLSFSSSIFDNSPKIIITTNMDLQEIDPAILRPGRCFDHLTLHPLGYEQAQTAWLELLGLSIDDFFNRFSNTSKEITQAELMEAAIYARMSSEKRSYVLNSKCLSHSTKQRVGL